MLSVIITVVSFIVMLLIIAYLVYTARREHRRHQQTVAAQSSYTTHPLERQLTGILHVEHGKVVGVQKITPEVATQFSLSASWYRRWRTLVSLGFLLIILLALFVQDGIAGGALQSIGQTFNIARYFQPVDLNTPAHPLPSTASARIVRIDSAARNQYLTDYQWEVWSYSSCSGIAMEMVMNAYGRHLIASDVLQKELDFGVWSVSLGLLTDQGIAITADYFGFNTVASHTMTLQDLITTGNQGSPIIVGVRDNYYYPGGHIFVIRGGDSQYVYIADSSPANFQRMTHAMFLGMWQGFAAILTPR